MKNTWVEINKTRLTANIRAVHTLLAPGTRVVFVVKANAYGHGLTEVAPVAGTAGVNWFDVAHLHEAVELRRLLPGCRVLIVGVVDPEQVRECVESSFTPVIVSEDHGQALSGAAQAIGARLVCHVKVDTGMGRLGLNWEDAPAVIRRLACSESLSLEGICTHLASSDNPDRDFSDEQLRRFHRVLDQCGQRGIHFQVRHVSNSAALLRERTWHLDGVRAGIVLYGYPPVLPGERPRADLRPVLQWKTRLVQVKRVPRGFPVSYDSTHTTERETRIGTFPVGYADGYPRALSNRAQVLVHGRRAPVVGRVTMNLSMVDLGPDSLAQAGDEVVLLGEQGGASLWADELARWAGTIPYEVLTNIRAIDRRVVE